MPLAGTGFYKSPEEMAPSLQAAAEEERKRREVLNADMADARSNKVRMAAKGVGTIAGAIVGLFFPAVGSIAGASAGNQLGGMVGDTLAPDERKKKQGQGGAGGFDPQMLIKAAQTYQSYGDGGSAMPNGGG